jgi:predicted transcriptional regulator
MDFNEQIKRTGLKKKWVAERLGIHRTLLSHYISGTRPMPERIEIELKRLLRMYMTHMP